MKSKLSFYCRQIRGVSYKANDLHKTLNENAVTLFRANNINNGEINFDDVVYVDKSRVSDEQYLKKGDILVCASSGSKNLVGKAAQIDFEGEFTFGAFCKAIRPKDIDQKYLGAYFQSPIYRNRISNMSQGANINNIRNEHIDELEIPIYSQIEQKQITQKVSAINELIKLSRQQLTKFDELVKSRFVEMFGDPVTNPMGWEVKKLKDLSHKISDGVHAKPKYTDEGKPFISVVNINTGNIDFSNCKFVSEADYEKMIKSTHPEKGDVLYTKVGATYGIPAYVDTDEDFCLYVSVCLIKPKHELVNARFLTESMRLPYIKHQADRRIRGIGVPDLHLNQIREFDILCPPIDLQERYIEFVELANKSKLVAKALLAKCELLREKLMQDYFC